MRKTIPNCSVNYVIACFRKGDLYVLPVFVKRRELPSRSIGIPLAFLFTGSTKFPARAAERPELSQQHRGGAVQESPSRGDPELPGRGGHGPWPLEEALGDAGRALPEAGGACDQTPEIPG